MTTVETPAGRAEIDPQDPLPESNWKPRRAYVGWSMVGDFVLIALALYVDAPPAVTIWLIVFAIVIATLYMVAPSAEQIANIMQHVSAMRAGITFRSTARADVDRGTVEHTTESTPAISPGAQPGD